MFASRCVPNGCARNSTTRKACSRGEMSSTCSGRSKRTIEMGITCDEIDDFAIAIPPTAEVTETAGVNIPMWM